MTNPRLIPLFLATAVLFCSTPNAQSDRDRLGQSLKSIDKKMSSMQKDLSRSMSDLSRARKGLEELNRRRESEQHKARQVQEWQAKEIASLQKELARCKQESERQREVRAEEIQKMQAALQRNHAELGAILATATEQRATRRRRCTPTRASITKRIRKETARRAKGNKVKAAKKINEDD